MPLNEKLSLLRCYCLFFAHLSFGLLLVCIPISSRADSLEDAARALARRVATSLRGASAALEERNLSAVQESGFLNFAAAFREELQGRGIKIASRERSARIVLTLSESVDGYLGIVRVQRGENSEVMMQPLAGSVQSAGNQSTATMGLHKELMLSQELPLIDADVHFFVPYHLDTLGEQQIASYQWKENKWELVFSKLLPRKNIAARDLRGMVGHRVDAMAGLFPGEACRSGMQPWECEPYPWQLMHRFIDRELLESKKPSPWFSAAQFEMNGQDALVITGEDGLARVYSQGLEPLATIPGWGSEIATTHSGCGNGWQILVTGKGDWSSPDSVTGMEIEGDKVAKVTESIDFPGPVISMHQTESDKNRGRDMVIAVVHNLHSGLYEVYRLTITCPN